MNSLFVVLCFVTIITGVPLHEDEPGCLQQKLLDIFKEVTLEDTEQGKDFKPRHPVIDLYYSCDILLNRRILWHRTEGHISISRRRGI